MSEQHLPTKLLASNKGKSYQKRLRALAVRLADHSDMERRNFSRNLHNHVGHELGLARIKLSEILRSGRFEIPDELLADLLNIEEHLKQAVRQSRLIGHEYYPQVLDDAGLIPALEWLCEEYSTNKNSNVTLQIEGDFSKFSMGKELNSRLFTAVRECVYNAWKYSNSNTIRIELVESAGNYIEIRVIDDGVGFDVKNLDDMNPHDQGFGLFQIRELIEHLGGDFHCLSSSEKGTCIHMKIPLES